MADSVIETIYDYTVLREETVSTDEIRESPHDAVAESLFDLIKCEKSAITIGLEGPWGSGKSSVISILKKKIDDNNEIIPMFQFDAWAHEGDPLRRIFLESLIDFIIPLIEKKIITPKYPDTCIAGLKKHKTKINNREKITKTVSNVSTTKLGRFIGFSLLFVPIGSALLSNVKFPNLSLVGEPYWLYILCLLLAGFPLLVLLINLLRCLINRIRYNINIFTPSNWFFAQGDSQKTDTTSTSEDNERSSIEFQHYFTEILECFYNTDVKSLIIVIDNLDRIDPKDSLKIWSTLQTFLQQRSFPLDSDNVYKKTWFIIPYDRDGMSSLWSQKNDGKKDDNNLPALSKSFFDKCFQLRIEVPRLPFTIWTDYLSKKIDESLLLNPNDKDDVINILTTTREKLSDIPTPREIKNCINHIGFLLKKHKGTIPVRSIAFYVYLREISGNSVSTICNKLEDGSLKTDIENIQLSENILMDLSGLLFGVTPKVGAEILLIPKIKNAFSLGDGDKINELYQLHGDNLWSIINYHCSQRFEFGYILSSSHAIYSSVWENHKDKVKIYIAKISETLPISDDIVSYNFNRIDQFISLITICSDNHQYINKIYDYLLACFSHDLSKATQNKQIPDKLDIIINRLCETGNAPSKRDIPNLMFNNLINFVHKEQYRELYHYIKPSSKIVEEIASKIQQPSVQILSGTYYAVVYAIKSGIEGQWAEIVKNCKSYLESNGGVFSNHSPIIFKILPELEYRVHDIVHPVVDQVVRNGHFYSIISSLNEKVIYDASLLSAYIFKDQLQKVPIPEIANSASGMALVREFWKKNDEKNAVEILNKIEEYNLWELVWNISIDNSNLLGLGIIDIAIAESKVKLFNTTNLIEKIRIYKQFNGSKNTDALVKLFLNESQLLEEIDNVDIINYSNEFNDIVRLTNSEVIVNYISDQLVLKTRKDWDYALNNDTWLLNLAITSKSKKDAISFDNDFYDSLSEYIANVNQKPDILTDWQKENFQKLCKLLNPSFYNRLREKVTSLYIDNKFIVNDNCFSIIKELLLYPLIVKETMIINDLVEISIKKKDFTHIGIICSIIQNDSSNGFTVNNDIKVVIKKPIIALYNEFMADEVKRNMIEMIARKYKIDLSEDISDKKDIITETEGA